VQERRLLAPLTRHRLAFFGAAAVVVGLDQLTKQLALSELTDGPVHLVGSLRLALAFNDGAAFSLGSGRTGAIAFVALGVALVLLWLGWRATRAGYAVGFGVVLGGALGNLADRALRDGDGVLGGRVVDFVDLRWWPVFNLADASLWVGIAILLVTSWRDGERDAAADEGQG
jgi:signal peptidase II